MPNKQFPNPYQTSVSVICH